MDDEPRHLISQEPSRAWSVIFSDLPTPAEASVHVTGPYEGFAQAGNRYTLFGITL
jgi:hypothetical protein